MIHVSELAIDRMLAGELPAADAAALRDHAAACTRCGAALDDALATQHALLPRLELPRRRVLPATLAGAAALAAALAIVVAWPRAHDAEVQTQTKGGAIVGFFVSHAGAVRRGGPQETVSPGDRVELFTTTTAPAWFAAISSDGTVYAEPRPIAPGREQVLPAAIELDDSRATEVVTAMFCAEAFDVKAPPADCQVDRFTLVKVPR